jgi:hypothetical protein
MAHERVIQNFGRATSRKAVSMPVIFVQNVHSRGKHNADYNSSTFKQQYYDTVDIGVPCEICFIANT